MEKNCVICGKDAKGLGDGYVCVKGKCKAEPCYCLTCAPKHISEIRCPRHFLKSHREDVARYKKVRFE